MKKSGFTLAEVLIAMGIIAVMGAIMATSFNNAKPNKTKVLYLKAYDALVTSVNAIVEDSSLYQPIYEKVKVPNTCTYYYDLSNYPLFNFDKPLNADFNTATYEGQYKFANLLKEAMNGKLTGSSCNSTQCKFTTKPGNIEWNITVPSDQNVTLENAPKTGNVKFRNVITITIPRNSNSDTFTFWVYADGTVIPKDTGNTGYTFIRKRTNLRGLNDGAAITPPTDPTNSYAIGTTIPRQEEGTSCP